MATCSHKITFYTMTLAGFLYSGIFEMESKDYRVQIVSLIFFAFKSTFKSDKQQSRLSHYTVPVSISEKYKKVDGRMSADLNKTVT